MKHFDASQGERSRHHEMKTEANSRFEPPRRAILNIRELSSGERASDPRLSISIMVDEYICQARLTVDEARGLAEAAMEFVNAWTPGK